jgi:biopolymer transport protein ExbD
MLDMSFQLLAFFVIYFRAVNTIEGQLDMYLPAAGAAVAKAPDLVDLSKTSDVDIDQASDVTVVVESVAGEINRLAVKDKATTTPVGDTRALQQRLAELRQGAANQSNVKIQADGRVKYARLVDVMDACMAAGFQKVGFAPPPDLGDR